MGLFSKIKDYHSKLEEVLERKIFSANVKNLLLSMIYKIEISYKDYKEVKRVVKPKNEFIEEFIEIIDNYCDNIKLVEPNTEKPAFITMNGKEVYRFVARVLPEYVEKLVADAGLKNEDIVYKNTSYK